ncbi:MAG: glycogen/starch/alpha-glucan phosphorylase [Oscillospiraceae bacterium]|nr:glycogen/starch/alpha-glucan phosphorylase [Oscillospiraceae bacterium]
MKTKNEIIKNIEEKLKKETQKSLSDASNNEIYRALSAYVNELLAAKRETYEGRHESRGTKRIYYISMEFLMGRSLKTNLFNLGLADEAAAALKEKGINLSDIYEEEPDAGLGNGGLGRLAACFLDAMATTDSLSMGYSICYEYGIFKQRIVDGWQAELPDNWLPGGDVWLNKKTDKIIPVHFEGEIEEIWDNGYHMINHKGGTVVDAVPYDMYVSGYDSDSVSVLRLWRAQSHGFDMELFNKGDYINAVSKQSEAEAISKVLYPNDNHQAGKELRLRQQYFMSAASVGDIVNKHMEVYGTLDNLSEKVAIHINDTHPTLAIPELMRVLFDDCGYSWDKAYRIVNETFAYTNHTVMKEALECWDEELFKRVLPRIYQIVREINARTFDAVTSMTGDWGKAERMAIIWGHSIRMANLCCHASHSVNGVSKLHSEIIKDEVFRDFYSVYPEKFGNVTNGIAYRRWLLQSNKGLSNLLSECIGDGFKKDASALENFRKFENDKSVLKRLSEIKLENKKRFADHVFKIKGVSIDPNTIFDVQVKRLHEYKRQQLNALNIISLYGKLLENPDLDIQPRTYIFGAKAAPGYYMAKQIIKLLCFISKDLENHPKIREKLNVVFIEDYNVTMSELLMPASEISEQISLAGTEASGTGNMKFMINGAVTLGTMDGANIEIYNNVGNDNIFIFGMKADEVNSLRAAGYSPRYIYENNADVKAAIDLLDRGFAGEKFYDIVNMLKNTDYYMTLADFDSYAAASRKTGEIYKDKQAFAKMSLNNIAGAGYFSADRAIMDYRKNIWHL